MAQAAGFTCDVCDVFALAVKNGSSIEPPKDWVAVKPYGHASLDVCTNACLALLGKLRWEGETQNEGKKFSFRQMNGTRSAQTKREQKA